MVLACCREEVLDRLDANLSQWQCLKVEGVPVPLVSTQKRTQVKTFTLGAVQSLVGPALTLAPTATPLDSAAAGTAPGAAAGAKDENAGQSAAFRV